MQDETTITDDADAREQRITEALRAITERRAVIEQAKGMLMLVYGVDADEAFDVLRKQSQDNNVKLFLVAEQVMKDLVELARNRGPVRQLALGGLIGSASQRIEHSAERQLDGQSKTGVPMKELGRQPR
jgi:ANTAR domain-containing protein